MLVVEAGGARLRMRRTITARSVCTALTVGVVLAACGGTSGHTPRTGAPTPPPNSTATDTIPPTPLPTPTAAPVTTHPSSGPTGVPKHKNTQPSAAPHVLVVMEENKGYAATLGSCGADPYFCSLAARYASFTNSHGVGHPSMPNYYAFISGATQGCSSDGCAPFSAPSLGSQLDAAGVPWTAYMESMPSACDKSNAGGYVVKHDPFVQSTATTSCASHVLPYPGSSGLLAALGNGSAPDFVFITPNLTDDMHDGSVPQGDAWLKANVAPVLASPWFLNDNSTVIITMDEGDAGSTNQIPTVVISSHAAAIGGVSTSINHYAVLRAIESVFGLGHLGNTASAPAISNFFG